MAKKVQHNDIYNTNNKIIDRAFLQQIQIKMTEKVKKSKKKYNKKNKKWKNELS